MYFFLLFSEFTHEASPQRVTAMVIFLLFCNLDSAWTELFLARNVQLFPPCFTRSSVSSTVAQHTFRKSLKSICGFLRDLETVPARSYWFHFNWQFSKRFWQQETVVNLHHLKTGSFQEIVCFVILCWSCAIGGSAREHLLITFELKFSFTFHRKAHSMWQYFFGAQQITTNHFCQHGGCWQKWFVSFWKVSMAQFKTFWNEAPRGRVLSSELPAPDKRSRLSKLWRVASDWIVVWILACVVCLPTGGSIVCSLISNAFAFGYTYRTQYLIYFCLRWY